MPIEKNLVKIEKLLSLMDSDTLTKEDFIKSFEKVVNFVLKIQERQEKAINDLERTYQALLERMGMEYKSRHDELSGKVNHVFVKDRLDKMEGGIKEHSDETRKIVNEVVNKKLGELDTKMSMVKDGERGPVGLPGPQGPMPTEHLELMKQMQNEMKKIQNLLTQRPQGKAMGRAKVQYIRRIDLSSQVDGNRRSFTLPPDTVQVLAVDSSQFPFSLANADFTLEGNTLVFGATMPTIVADQTLVALVDVLFYP